MTKIPVPTVRTAILIALSVGAFAGAIAGCSDDDKSSGTPGPTTGNPDGSTTTNSDGGTTTQTDGSTTTTDSGTPVNTKFGMVAITSSAASHSILASFSNGGSTFGSCKDKTESTHGACKVTTCTVEDAGQAVVDAGDAGAVNAPHAGAISISGGKLSSPIVMNPKANGSYDFVFGTTPLYDPGQNVSVNAAGGDVPAFSGSAAAPGNITVTAPTFTTAQTSFNKSQDLNVTWTGGGAGKVNVLLSSTGAKFVSVTCSYDANTGTGTVPSAAMADLANSGTISIGGGVVTQIEAGDYDITYSLAGGGGASGMYTAN
jgi:hypothetical protein